jgi:hypothetical protein
VKANGSVSRKAFVIADKTMEGGMSVSGTRVHHWADLTTRRHYPGDHKIDLSVNGEKIAEETLKLFS